MNPLHSRTIICLLALLISSHVNVTWSAQFLWQTNNDSDDIWVYDLETGTVVKKIEVGPAPHGISKPPNLDLVYATVEFARPAGEVVAIDTTTLSISKRWQVCEEPENLATSTNGHWLFIPCKNGTYQVLDTRVGEIVKEIHTGGQPHNTIASHDGRMFLAPVGEPKAVTVVDSNNGHTTLGRIHFSGQVRPLALLPSRNLLLQQVNNTWGFETASTETFEQTGAVLHSNGGSLLWDLQNLVNRISWKIGQGQVFDVPYCHGLAVRPDELEVWALCGANLYIHSATESAFQEIAHIPLPGIGYWLTFSPDSQIAAIALPENDQVAIFNAQSRALLRTLGSGKGPKRNLIIAH
ncbi:MAG: DNA-binding beta-propeller fold protein YncE [Candidatus Azotimanducaceae bacterium]|jgi:DNA-binding beta-propeller fold protein YncE